MKKIITLAMIGISSLAFGQSDNVGIGTTQPDNSAILDLSSSTKGFLIPRMTASQKDLINSPAQGLQVFQTDGISGLYVFNGIKWVNSTAGTSAALDAWLGGGNSAGAADFIGTTNNQSLRFKVNNVSSGGINTAGGGANTYFGYSSGASVSGSANVAIGYETLISGAGSSNVALGFRALKSNGTGSNNLGLGNASLRDNSTGSSNVGIGSASLLLNTTGIGNLAIGASALNKITGNSNFNVALGTSSMINKTSGNNNVGIGLSTLRENLSGSNNTAIGHEAGKNATGASSVYLGYQAGMNEAQDSKLYIANSNTTKPLVYGDFALSFVTIGDVEVAKRSAAGTGGYNLLVKGGILTEKVKVALASTTDWADYVFEPSYKLMPLDEVESFTKENKHLPNVPSADEMAESGLDVAQTSKMFMEKIEELTLYMIELNKEIEELKKAK